MGPTWALHRTWAKPARSSLLDPASGTTRVSESSPLNYQPVKSTTLAAARPWVVKPGPRIKNHTAPVHARGHVRHLHILLARSDALTLRSNPEGRRVPTRALPWAPHPASRRAVLTRSSRSWGRSSRSWASCPSRAWLRASACRTSPGCIGPSHASG